MQYFWLSLLAAVMVAFLVAGAVIFKWVFDIRSRGDTLREDDPRGFYKGNRLIWQLFKIMFLLIFGYPNWWEPKLPVIGSLIRRRIFLIDWDKFVEGLAQEGKGKIIVSNHDGSASIFLELLALHLTGHNGLIGKMLHPIGLRFINRNVFFSFGIKGVDRVVIAPADMIAKSTHELALLGRETNDLAVQVIRGDMRQDRIMPFFPEGTRTRPMQKVRPRACRMIDHDYVTFHPLAVESKGLWEKGKWPNPYAGFRLIPGDPIHVDTIRRRANYLNGQFGVGYERAFMDSLMWEVGKLHLEKGDPEYAGYYNIPPEARYKLEIETK